MEIKQFMSLVKKTTPKIVYFDKELWSSYTMWFFDINGKNIYCRIQHIGELFENLKILEQNDIIVSGVKVY